MLLSFCTIKDLLSGKETHVAVVDVLGEFDTLCRLFSDCLVFDIDNRFVTVADVDEDDDELIVTDVDAVTRSLLVTFVPRISSLRIGRQRHTTRTASELLAEIMIS
jgi:hypothetical protein